MFFPERLPDVAGFSGGVCLSVSFIGSIGVLVTHVKEVPKEFRAVKSSYRNMNHIRGNGVVMKVPFRQQATEYDCVPTSLMNAMSYLFSRRELPPFVVHKVYKDCLDYEAARGTTGRAIRDIGFWLNCYTEKRFDKFVVKSRYIYGKQVHLKRNSRIIRCLEEHGTVLMCLHTSQYERHCVLCLRAEDDWLYCYDPSPRTRRYITDEAVQFVEPMSHHGPNLRIRSDWLERDLDNATNPDERKYVFGNTDYRECLLLNRIHL